MQKVLLFQLEQMRGFRGQNGECVRVWALAGQQKWQLCASCGWILEWVTEAAWASLPIGPTRSVLSSVVPVRCGLAECFFWRPSPWRQQRPGLSLYTTCWCGAVVECVFQTSRWRCVGVDFPLCGPSHFRWLRTLVAERSQFSMWLEVACCWF